MGKAMWLEYFLMMSRSFQLLAYSLPSSLKWTVTEVPWEAREEGSISKPDLPSEVQRKAASSPALRVTTSTRSATMNDE